MSSKHSYAPLRPSSNKVKGYTTKQVRRISGGGRSARAFDCYTNTTHPLSATRFFFAVPPMTEALVKAMMFASGKGHSPPIGRVSLDDSHMASGVSCDAAPFPLY